MHDLISRQAAIEVIDAAFPVDPMKSEYTQGLACGAALAKTYVEQLPSAQPEQKNCEYCHTDRDGYVKPLEKNCHAYIRFGMDGWTIELKAKGWNGKAPIRFCPMCGRDLLVK
jgi:hypothetical protein